MVASNAPITAVKAVVPLRVHQVHLNKHRQPKNAVLHQGLGSSSKKARTPGSASAKVKSKTPSTTKENNDVLSQYTYTVNAESMRSYTLIITTVHKYGPDTIGLGHQGMPKRFPPSRMELKK